MNHHFVKKSVHMRSFSGRYFLAFGLNTPYLSILSTNVGKYGPEKLQIRTLFTRCIAPLYLSGFLVPLK